MKTTAFNFLTIPFIIFASAFFLSCEDDAEKPSPVNDEGIKAKTEKVLSLRKDLDFVNRFVDANVMGQGSDGGRISYKRALIARMRALAPCAEGIEEELPDGSVKIALDFGAGCQTEDGVEIAGNVVMIFGFSDTALEFDLTFVDYSELSGEHAGEVVNGTIKGSIEIDLQASVLLQEMNQKLTISYANSSEATYHIIQKAELTESGLRITSLTTSGNLADGTDFATSLSKTMVYDLSCDSNFPVRGEELLTFQGNTILLSYGNGTCDDLYTIK